MQERVEQWSARSVLTLSLIISALPLLIVEMFPGQLKFVMAPLPILFSTISPNFSASWYRFPYSASAGMPTKNPRINIPCF